MANIGRRRITAGLGAAAALGPFSLRAQSPNPDIVIAGAQPLTGVFSFAGIASDLGLSEYFNWRNANGGVLGHKLKYVTEDTSYKVDVGVAVVKKMMAQYKPSFIFLDGTGLGKATARDLIEAGTVMATSTSCAAALVDPVNMPHYFSSGPTYPLMQEILMEYIAGTAKGAIKKPAIAYVYSDLEFGREGIPAGKARAEKLGLPIVADIMTKASGVDVTSEVAQLRRVKPDFVIFQGYVLSPIPEFIRQMREAGLTAQVLGTTYSMDVPTYQAIGALGEKWTGLFPYRYAYDKEAAMAKTMREQIVKAKPDLKEISIFTIHGWLSGMIIAEIAERCIKAGKPLNLPNMKAALESITSWDSGGLIGVPVDLHLHRIATGRMYSYNAATKQMDPISDWIQV